MSLLRRGDLVRARTWPDAPLWVVVSNDVRNQALDSAVLARISPAAGAVPGESAVRLGPLDPFDGYVQADFLRTEYASELTASGRLAPETLEAVSRAVRIALP